MNTYYKREVINFPLISIEDNIKLQVEAESIMDKYFVDHSWDYF